MEENQLTNTPESNDTNGCVNCGNTAIVEGYSTRLCGACRELFIKYPIPIGIKIFAGAVVLVLIFSLFTFPKHLALGMHLERGKQYEQKHQFKSAQQEFAQVVQKVPDNVEAKGHLMVAAFYNMDFATFSEKGQQMQGVNIEDGELLSRLNNLADKLEGYFPDDSLENWMNRHGGRLDSIPDTALHQYLIDHPRNVYGLLAYAGKLYDKENWVAVDSVAQLILGIDIENFIALRLLANAKKEQGLLDESIKYCDRIMQINKDLPYAYAIKARSLLKQKKDALALELATKSVSIDQKDGYCNATLALAYHFNNMQAKRDALIQQIKAGKDSSMIDYMQFVIDVIEQKEKFRN